jgi:hypothetical protein
MIYPNKVRFGGVEYRVVISQEEIPHPWKEGMLINAACLPDDRLILVHDHPSSPSSTEESLLHEILEGIIDTYDIQMEHQTIKTLGVALHQVLAEAKMDFSQSALNIPVNTTVH